VSESKSSEPPSVAERLELVLEATPEVDLAVLFGSAARGEERPDSDVDVGVLRLDSSSEHRAFVEAALGRAVGRTVDVVYLDEAPPLLRFEIARDGVPLLERSPHAWADFRVRAMRDWWDWAPYARRLNEAAIGRLRERVGHGQG
jgi:predicted nucleotidyltransferase